MNFGTVGVVGAVGWNAREPAVFAYSVVDARGGRVPGFDEFTFGFGRPFSNDGSPVLVSS